MAFPDRKNIHMNYNVGPSMRATERNKKLYELDRGGTGTEMLEPAASWPHQRKTAGQQRIDGHICISDSSPFERSILRLSTKGC